MPAMEDAASAELATAPPRDSPAALPGRQLAEALHEEQYPALVRFLLFNGATWTAAQDAAQDAFTQMCTPGLSIAYPKAWLRKVAWRFWVKQKVAPEELCSEPPEPHELTMHWQTPAQSAELDQENKAVIAQLLQLPAKQRAAMAWTLDGFTTEESARAMGTTPAAVRQNLARARTALKASLGLSGDGRSTKEEGR